MSEEELSRQLDAALGELSGLLDAWEKKDLSAEDFHRQARAAAVVEADDALWLYSLESGCWFRFDGVRMQELEAGG